MKHIVTLVAILFANFVSAQATEIQFIDWNCDNGSQTRYIMKRTFEFSVKVEVSNLQENSNAKLRCVLNGNLHSNISVFEDGVYLVTFTGVGLGNPDHNITLSVWEEWSQISNDISLSNIGVWTWSPDILEETISEGPGQVSLGLTLSGFIIPSGSPGYGGCPEHKLVLISEVVTEGETLGTTEVVIEEGYSNQSHTFVFDAPLEQTIVCGTNTVWMKDTSEDGSDFEPEIVTSTEDSLCLEVSGQIQTSIHEEYSVKQLAYPNPFENSVNIGSPQNHVIIYDTKGVVVYIGPGGNITTLKFLPGVYVARNNSTKTALRIVKQ